MRKQLLLIFALLSFIWLPARAQSFYIDLNYQSFHPFIHFQLDVGTRRARYNPYQSSYLKGYMDGVNGVYYSDYRFYDLVRQIDAYEAGYRDGERDRQLYCRLHGYRRLPRRPFVYDDYYSPRVSVQLWLNNLSFTFLRAPERRLPRYWARRAQPSLRRYRARFKQHRYFAHVKQRYKRNQDHLRKRARGVRKKYRRSHKNYRSQSGSSRKLNRKRAITRVRNHSRGANRQHKSTHSTHRRTRILHSRPKHKTRAKTSRKHRVHRQKASRQRSRSSRKAKTNHRRTQQKSSKSSRGRHQKTPHRKVQRHRSSSRTKRVKHSRQRSKKNGGHHQSRRRGHH